MLLWPPQKPKRRLKSLQHNKIFSEFRPALTTDSSKPTARFKPCRLQLSSILTTNQDNMHSRPHGSPVPLQFFTVLHAQRALVFDHCGNADPHVINGEKVLGDDYDGSPFWHTAEGWKEDMAALGALPNTFCKISGIVARAQEGWNAETLAPTINHCLDSFGEQRVIFGGDWPVCLFGAQLNQWVAAYREVLSKRSKFFQNKAMFSNAIQLYRLHEY